MNDGRINWIVRNPSAVAEKLIRLFAEAGYIVAVEMGSISGVYTVTHGAQSASITAECIREEDNTFRPKRAARRPNRLTPMVRLPRKKHYAGRANAYLSYLDEYYADLSYEDDLRNEAVGIYY